MTLSGTVHQHKKIHVRPEIFKAMKVQVVVFWMMLCSDIRYQHFRGPEDGGSRAL